MILWTRLVGTKLLRTNRGAPALALGVSLIVSGCGYHTVGSKVDLPQNIHTHRSNISTTKRTHLRRCHQLFKQARF